MRITYSSNKFIVYNCLFLYNFLMNKKTINIKDIAQKTGFSTATVSRVMNHPEKVNSKTREKVLESMSENGYLPNNLARGLILGKTHTISLLVPDIEHTFYQMILSGVETIAMDKKYNVFLCNTHGNSTKEYEYIEMALNKGVDGLILATSSLKSNQTKILDNYSIPFVHIGQKSLFGCNRRCYIDYCKDAAKLTNHLLSMGHDDIALILNSESSEMAEQIADGYSSALGKSPAELKNRIFSCDNSVEGGYNTINKLLNEKNLSKAVIAATDSQAFGILKAAKENNLNIPDDMALACMTDSPICSLVSPPLTCIASPSKRLGMVAARLLFDSISDNSADSFEQQDVILQSTLKIRNSCGNKKNIYELYE